MTGAGFTVNVEIKGATELSALLARMGKAAPRQAAAAVAKTAWDVQKYAKQNMTAQGARDTGITINNINVWSDDGYKTAEIGVSEKHVSMTHATKGRVSYYRTSTEVASIAAIIEFGHGVITPKKGKFLRWWWPEKGIWVFRKSSPAQPPRPYLYPGFQRGVTQFVAYLKSEFGL